mgnify:CR=1 FL=1
MDTEEIQPTETEIRVAELIMSDEYEDTMTAISHAVYQSLPDDVELTAEDIIPWLAGPVVAAVDVYIDAHESSELAEIANSSAFRPYAVAWLMADAVASIVADVRADDAIDLPCPRCQIEDALEVLIDARIALLQLEEEQDLMGVKKYHAAQRAVAGAVKALGMTTEWLNAQTYERAGIGIGQPPTD